ncbi:hypothetical protein Pelo_4475 [Pelomyxa schiedti]|nr:hypothetical protein Pelo_4475 [Pelomyxa schiedti]
MNDEEEELEQPPEYDHFFKILVIGGPKVGKTTFARRFTFKPVSEIYRPSVGIQFFTAVRLFGKSKIKINLLDVCSTAPNFASTTGSFCKNASGAVVIYSNADRSSFEAAGNCLRTLKLSGNPQLILVENLWVVKPSTPSTSPPSLLPPFVEHKEGTALAEEFGVPFVSLCTRTGLNVERTMVLLTLGLKVGTIPYLVTSTGPLVELCMYTIATNWPNIPNNTEHLTQLPEDLKQRILAMIS